MDTRQRSLSWSGILAGAAIAIGAGWTGELLGGWLALSGTAEDQVGATSGLTLALVFLCVGALAGGFVAGRRAGEGRSQGALHGAILWGVVAAFGAATFAILGGNVALVTGLSGQAMRAGFAYSFFALLLSLPLAAIGGASGARRAAASGGRRILVRAPRTDVERARAQREVTPRLQTRTHSIEVDTTEGDHRHDIYREGVSYPEGEGSGRPPVH